MIASTSSSSAVCCFADSVYRASYCRARLGFIAPPPTTALAMVINYTSKNDSAVVVLLEVLQNVSDRIGESFASELYYYKHCHYLHCESTNMSKGPRASDQNRARFLNFGFRFTKRFPS